MTSLFFSSVVLGFAWFAAVNAVASLVSWALARALISSRRERSGELLLAIRLLPSTAALVFVAAMFLPGHWRFEPRDAQESFGLVCWMLAWVGGLLLGRAGWRAAMVGWAGWRLRARGCRTAIAAGHVIYELPGLQGVSLAGVLRTRILVGSAVRRALTPAELDVAIAHELAHRRSFDNLKRFAMCCAPDLFGPSATARQIEERWGHAAEWSADACAVEGDDRRAVHLASALLKVARLGTALSGRLASPAWSTLHNPPLLEQRVRRLAAGDLLPVSPAPGAAAIMLTSTVGLVALASGVLASEGVHRITEALLRLLP
jgi:hypothetical protein